MCLVEVKLGRHAGRRWCATHPGFRNQPAVKCAALKASHRDGAAERHMTVAVGFSPRTGADGELCRVATPEINQHATHVRLPTEPLVETHGYHHVVALRRKPAAAGKGVNFT